MTMRVQKTPSVKAKSNMLGALPPVRGTAYFTCRTPACRARVPLRVRKPGGYTSKVGVCPFCLRHRELTASEQILITHWIHYLYAKAGKFSQRTGIDIDISVSVALEAACYAAATFDPANEFSFGTHLTQHVDGRLNDRTIEDQAAVRHAYTHYDSDRKNRDDDPMHVIDGRPCDLQLTDNAAHVDHLLRHAHLTDRERDIVRRQFGLAGYPRQNLAEIGAVYGIGRERVRQLSNRALDQMRCQFANGEAA